MQIRTTTELKAQGFSYTSAKDFQIANTSSADLSDLSHEWNRLEGDKYLHSGARFRERRFGRFAFLLVTRELIQLEHIPYFQASTTNTYAGGIQREVAPLTKEFVNNPLLTNLISIDFDCFPTEEFDPKEWWYVACHLFRIIGRADEDGEPTPEGVHRDDIHYGAMHLMGRVNTEGGLSRIHNKDQSIKAELCLKEQMDTLFWPDRDILHSVTPIKPRNDEEEAVRDILILGYTHTPDILKQDKAGSN